MKDRDWIIDQLSRPGGVFPTLSWTLQHAAGRKLDAKISLAQQLENCPCGSRTLVETFAGVLQNEVGLWFYAGWYDQAALFLHQVSKGDIRLLRTFCRLLDDFPAEQNGDMLIGFAPIQEPWVSVIEIRRERRLIIYSTRAMDSATLAIINDRLGEPQGNP